MLKAHHERYCGLWFGSSSILHASMVALGGLLISAQGVGATNTACQVTASPADIDYVPVTRSALHINPREPSALSFEERILNVTTTCDESAGLTLTFRGQRDATGRFRFGDNGYLEIRLISAQLDGQPITLTRHVSQGGLPDGRIQADDVPLLYPGDSLSVATDAQARSGHQLIIQLKVTPTVPRGSLFSSAPITLYSNLSIDLSRR